MQIHELPTFQGAPTPTDYMPIDDGTITYKVAADGLGITTQMTVAEAAAGTITAPRVIAPDVFYDSVDEITDDGITATTKALYTALGWVEPQ